MAQQGGEGNIIGRRPTKIASRAKQKKNDKLKLTSLERSVLFGKQASGVLNNRVPNQRQQDTSIIDRNKR